MLIFAGFIFQSHQQLQVLEVEAFDRLFGDGEIRDPEHKHISESHICSSMDDLLKLCEYEKSMQEEISRLPESQLKASYYQHLRTEVKNQFPNNGRVHVKKPVEKNSGLNQWLVKINH